MRASLQDMTPQLRARTCAVLRLCRVAAILTIVAVSAFLQDRARADFSGPYALPQSGLYFLSSTPASTAVGTWTLLNSNTHTYLNAYFATSSSEVHFDTSISVLHDAGQFLDVQLTNTIAADGILSFDYSVSLFTTGPFSAVNYAGYTLNGALVKLPAGTGSVNLPVNSGDVFGFDAYAGPNCIVCQPAFAGGTTMTVTNFNAPVPEASTVTFFVSGAVGLALLRVSAKISRACAIAATLFSRQKVLMNAFDRRLASQRSCKPCASSWSSFFSMSGRACSSDLVSPPCLPSTLRM